MLSLGAVVASRSVARTQALEESVAMTGRLARLVVEPRVAGMFQGSPYERIQAREALTADVISRRSDGYLREVLVWRLDGSLVYASYTDKVGLRFDPPDEVIAAITEGRSSSAFESQPEVPGATSQPEHPGFVEVYVPFDVAGQPRMAFEAYYDYGHVNNTANALLSDMLPVVLIPLLLLQLFQIPIAVSLARRVRHHEAEQSSRLEWALRTSENERSRLAADLHDGPIQDLAGIGYALGAIAPSIQEEYRSLMSGVQESLHGAVDSLRRLMADLYPPEPDAMGLSQGIKEMTVPLEKAGITVTMAVDSLPMLDRDIVTTVYRVAREALTNVVKHAQADKVSISLGAAPPLAPGGATILSLTIIDNGIGLSSTDIERHAAGHLGLRLLKDRLDDVGGALTLGPGPEGGTAVRAEIPLPQPA